MSIKLKKLQFLASIQNDKVDNTVYSNSNPSKLLAMKSDIDQDILKSSPEF